jgi:hypothetical protein
MATDREMFKVFADFINHEGEEPLDTQKAILAIAYLLEWGSEIGNNPLSGAAANGLSQLLKKCSEDVGMLFAVDDIAKAGGELRNLNEPAEGERQ